MIDSAILARRFEAGHLPAAGIVADLVATESERAALASACDLIAVNSLAGEATLTPDGRGAVMVEGRVVADIVQACVVTLEPVEQHIDEAFSVRFVAPDSPDAPRPTKAGKEVVVDPAAPDPPEIMEGTAIDLGALVEEMFVLAIDPYPRAPGAALPADAAKADETGAESPFAVLRQQGTTDG